GRRCWLGFSAGSRTRGTGSRGSGWRSMGEGREPSMRSRDARCASGASCRRGCGGSSRPARGRGSRSSAGAGSSFGSGSCVRAPPSVANSRRSFRGSSNVSAAPGWASPPSFARSSARAGLAWRPSRRWAYWREATPSPSPRTAAWSARRRKWGRKQGCTWSLARGPWRWRSWGPRPRASPGKAGTEGGIRRRQPSPRHRRYEDGAGEVKPCDEAPGHRSPRPRRNRWRAGRADDESPAENGTGCEPMGRVGRVQEEGVEKDRVEIDWDSLPYEKLVEKLDEVVQRL